MGDLSPQHRARISVEIAPERESTGDHRGMRADAEAVREDSSDPDHDTQDWNKSRKSAGITKTDTESMDGNLSFGNRGSASESAI